jgi:hypothetical protein
MDVWDRFGTIYTKKQLDTLDFDSVMEWVFAKVIRYDINAD